MPVVAVFGSSASLPEDDAYGEARRLGDLLARAGVDVATGGYGGLMEAVSNGAARHGGRVIGVTAPSVFPERTGPNPHVTEERRADSLVERIHELIDIADAAVALPGSIGTLTELMVAWNLAFVAQFSGSKPLPVFAVGWGRLLKGVAADLGMGTELVTCADTVDEVAELLMDRFDQESGMAQL